MFVDKLMVVNGWEENAGNTDFDMLRGEGRGMIVRLESDNTEANLQQLSQYALCVRADYVKHNGTYD